MCRCQPAQLSLMVLTIVSNQLCVAPASATRWPGSRVWDYNTKTESSVRWLCCKWFHEGNERNVVKQCCETWHKRLFGLEDEPDVFWQEVIKCQQDFFQSFPTWGTFQTFKTERLKLSDVSFNRKILLPTLRLARRRYIVELNCRSRRTPLTLHWINFPTKKKAAFC